MGKKRALIIGINEYEYPGFETLKYAESDARAIYDVLVKLGYWGFLQKRM